MKKSIEYGTCSPKSDFDRRPSTPHSVSYVGPSLRGKKAGSSSVYAFGKKSKGKGK